MEIGSICLSLVSGGFETIPETLTSVSPPKRVKRYKKPHMMLSFRHMMATERLLGKTASSKERSNTSMPL
jgi:hypothetical protein